MGKVIIVEQYRAFSGVMRIMPRNAPAHEVRGDWLYKPDTGCWYCKGSSYPEEICEILEVT